MGRVSQAGGSWASSWGIHTATSHFQARSRSHRLEGRRGEPPSRGLTRPRVCPPSTVARAPRISRTLRQRSSSELARARRPPTLPPAHHAPRRGLSLRPEGCASGFRWYPQNPQAGGDRPVRGKTERVESASFEVRRKRPQLPAPPSALASSEEQARDYRPDGEAEDQPRPPDRADDEHDAASSPPG